MAGMDNLKPLKSVDEARELGRKGGKASGEARRKKKAMREQMEMLLSLPFADEEAKEKMKELGIPVDDIDNQMALMIATYQKALTGDTSAINIVREVIGERVQEIKVNTGIDAKVKELEETLDKV